KPQRTRQAKDKQALEEHHDHKCRKDPPPAAPERVISQAVAGYIRAAQRTARRRRARTATALAVITPPTTTPPATAVVAAVQRSATLRQSSISRSEALAAQATSLSATNVPRGMLLSLQAFKTWPRSRWPGPQGSRCGASWPWRQASGPSRASRSAPRRRNPRRRRQHRARQPVEHGHRPAHHHLEPGQPGLQPRVQPGRQDPRRGTAAAVGWPKATTRLIQRSRNGPAEWPRPVTRR